MKKTAKLVFMSIVTIALCVSLIAGATFALFTSEDSVNIAVSSGKVDVKATAKISDAWSALATDSGYVDNHDLKSVKGGLQFTNGGTATYDDVKNIVSIAKITPGDGVKVTISTENKSDVAIKYETVITNLSKDMKLFEGLSIKVDGSAINKKLSTAVSNWTTIGAHAPIADIEVEIELPIDADKDYMMDDDGNALECELMIGIYAIQSNGNDDKYQNVILVNDVEQLKENLASAEQGDVFALDAGEYVLDSDIVIPSGVGIVGAQKGTAAKDWIDDDEASKTVIKASDDISGDRLLQILQDDENAVSDVVFDGVMVDCNNKNVKGIFVKKSTGSAMKGIVIKNCAFIDSANDAIDVCNTDGAVIEGNYVRGVYDNGIRLGNYKNQDGRVAYVCNNVVEGAIGTTNGAIAVTEGAGDVVVRGNVIKNVTSQHQYAGSIGLGESAITIEKLYEGGTILVEDNTLEDVEQGIAVYKFSAKTSDDKVIIRNNTITNYGVFAIATGSLNYNKLETSVVEITNNTITSSVEEGNVPAIYIETKNQYGETTSNWKVIATDNTVNGENSDLNKEYFA